MALRRIEGFDSASVAQLANKWENFVTSAGSIVAARTGNGLWYTGNVSAAFEHYIVNNYQQTWVIGMAIMLSSHNRDDNYFLGFFQDGTQHMSLRQMGASTNFLQAYLGSTAVATSNNVFTQGVMHWMEVKCTVANAGGLFEVYVDGSLQISYSGDTQNGASALCNRIVFRHGANSGGSFTTTFDDIYVLDGSGSAPYNDYLGNIRVDTLFPNANGNSSEMVGSDGNNTDNYLLVDDTTTSDDDTTYVGSSTVGDKDTYAYTDLTGPLDVKAIQISPRLRKASAGTRSVHTVTRLAGTEVNGDDLYVPESYVYNREVQTTKPGGGAWTVSDVNAAEFGVEVAL